MPVNGLRNGGPWIDDERSNLEKSREELAMEKAKLELDIESMTKLADAREKKFQDFRKKWAADRARLEEDTIGWRSHRSSRDESQELQELQNERDEKVQQVKELKLQIGDMSAQKRDVNRLQDKQAREIKTLKHQLEISKVPSHPLEKESLKSQHHQLDWAAQKGTLEQRIQEVNVEKSQLEKQVRDLETDVSGYETKVQKLQQGLQSQQNKQERQTQEIALLKRKLEKSEADSGALEKEANRVRQQLQTVRGHVSKPELEGERAKSDKISDLKEIGTLKQQLQELQDNANARHKEDQTLQEQLREELAQEKAKQVERLREIADDHQRQVQNLQQEQQDQWTAEKLKLDHSTKVQRDGQARASNTLQKEIQDMKAQRKAIEKSQQQQRDEWGTEKATLEFELKESKSRLSIAQEKETEVLQLQDQRDKQTRETETLKRQIQKLTIDSGAREKKQYDKWASEKRQLEEQLEKISSKLDSHESDNKRLQQELHELSNIKGDLENELCAERDKQAKEVELQTQKNQSLTAHAKGQELEPQKLKVQLRDQSAGNSKVKLRQGRAEGSRLLKERDEQAKDILKLKQQLREQSQSYDNEKTVLEQQIHALRDGKALEVDTMELQLRDSETQLGILTLALRDEQNARVELVKQLDVLRGQLNAQGELEKQLQVLRDKLKTQGELEKQSQVLWDQLNAQGELEKQLRELRGQLNAQGELEKQLQDSRRQTKVQEPGVQRRAPTAVKKLPKAQQAAQAVLQNPIDQGQARMVRQLQDLNEELTNRSEVEKHEIGKRPEVEKREVEKLHKQLRDLNEELAKRDRGVKLLLLEVEETRAQSSGHVQQVKKLHRQLEDRSASLKVQLKKADDLESRRWALERELRDRNEELETLKRSLLNGTSSEEALQAQINRKNATIIELRQKFRAQEQQVQRVQEAAKNCFETELRREVLADSEIQYTLLNDVVRPPKEWSRSYAVEKLDTKNLMYSSYELQQEFGKMTAAGSTLESIISQYPPHIFVNALLAHYIAKHVFDQPFFPLNDGKQTNFPKQMSFPEQMMKLYCNFLKVDEAEAHTWRSQTLELLSRTQAPENPRTSENNRPDAVKRVKEFQTDHCDSLAHNFINGPAESFLTPSRAPDRRHRDLVDVIQKASFFAFTLWKQRTALVMRGCDDLKGRKFSCDSRDMELHRIHGLEPDDDDKNGEDVGMVVQPGFVAKGDGNGERYDKVKVWAKAVVLLSERGEA